MQIELKTQTDHTLAAISGLVRRDNGVPGLGLLLDPERLLETMATQLNTSQIDAITLNYLRYKPGMNCLARFKLNVGGRTVNAYAKAHGDDARSKMGKSTERPVVNGILGPGRVVLEDRKIIFSTFPNDAKLASLQRFGDLRSRQRLFDRVFDNDPGWRTSVPGDPLNYKPERRYVVRLTRPDGESALAKFYSQSGYVNAHTVSRKLKQSLYGFCPEMIGRSRKHRVIAYRWLPGATLRQLHADGQFSVSNLVATAEALAGFHASGCDGLSVEASGVQRERLTALAEQFGMLLPDIGDRVKSVAQRLADWLESETPVKQAVHGDFYDKQAIVNNGKVSLIDLDAACLGNPLLDLGNYIAHLEKQSVCDVLPANDVQVQTDTLVGTYERLTSSIPVGQLKRYVAFGLFGLIHNPFRDWSPDWPIETERLLRRVENLMVR